MNERRARIVRWWLFAIFAVLVLLGVGVTAAYYTSPRWLPGLVVEYAPRYGVAIERIEFAAPPTLNHLALRTLALRRGALQVNGTDIHADFDRAELANGRLRRLHAARLAVTLASEQTPQPAEPLPDPRTLWARVPIDELRVDDLEVRHVASGVHARGRVAFTPAALSIAAQLAAPDLARGYGVSGSLRRDGALSLRVLTPAPAPAAIVRLDARWHDASPTPAPPAASQSRVDARLFARPTAEQVRALSALVGAETSSGTLDLDLRSELPWPLPALDDLGQLAQFASSLALTGHARVDWRGALPKLVKELELHADAQFSRAAGAPLHSVDVQLADDMLIAGHWITPKPLVLFGQPMTTSFRLDARSPLQLRVTRQSASLQGAVRARLGDAQAFATVITRGPLQANIDAVAAGRFDGLRANGNVQLSLPRTSFARFDARADVAVRGNGRALALTVARDARLSLGRLGDWTRGTTHARARKPITARFDPRDLRWETGAIDAAIDLPKAEFAGEAARIDDAPLRIARASGVAGNRIRASGAFASRIAATGRATSFAAEANVALDGNRSHTEGRVRLGSAALPIAFRNDYDLARKSGSVVVQDSLRWSSPILGGLLGGSAPTVDVTRGSLRIDARADYTFVGQATRMKLAAQLGWDGLATTYADYRVDGVAGEARLAFDGERLSARDVTLRIANTFVGTDIREIESRFDFDGKRITAQYARARVLGGKVRTGAFDYLLEGGNADMVVELDGVLLADALALQDQAITGSGIVDGRLPVTIRANVPEVRGGQVTARPPGGRIAYAKAAEYAKNIGQQGVEFAIAALQDFHYTRLESGIDYDRANVLTLAIKLHGRNPTVENGRIINYNLNVTQNVADLLRSLRATDEVTRKLEQRLQPTR